MLTQLCFGPRGGKSAATWQPSCQKVFEESGSGRKFFDFLTALSHNKQFGACAKGMIIVFLQKGNNYNFQQKFSVCLIFHYNFLSVLSKKLVLAGLLMQNFLTKLSFFMSKYLKSVTEKFPFSVSLLVDIIPRVSASNNSNSKFSQNFIHKICFFVSIFCVSQKLSNKVSYKTATAR